MKSRAALGVLIAVVWLSGRAMAQDPPLADPDPGTVALPVREISLKQFLPRMAADQKRIWSFPVTAAQGKGWKPALGVIGATAALIALDPIDTPYFQRTSFQQAPAVHRFNHVLSGTNTALAIAAVPVSFYVTGLVRKDSYASQTALLAGEAVANAEIVALVMKDVDRRMRPSEVGPNGNFSDTWFETKNRSAGGFGSFPSGHSAAAFAVANVFAERYPKHRWVPWVAYGIAGAIGFSRVSGQAHFPSDVFLGAALGFSTSHYVVLR
ncbi:MAG TPA: phosphatase PAP2 family protein [Bryobacteraceae bacterium]|nr:phosphatase PAP2 family protein [Bryobacteraceae bacterium]